MKRFFSFTLSEVLISLVIIGIIAAITVPVIYANYQERALKSALKKNYSVLKQALDKYYIDNGVRLEAADGKSGNGILKNKIINYFSVMYDCGYGSSNYKIESCFSSGSDIYKTYNGKSNIYSSMFDDGQFVLNDGSLILIENNSSSNVYFSVDVNGFGKKPNRLGKDLFMFQLMEDGELLPMGDSRTNYAYDTYCSETSSSNMNGAGCTYKVLQD